MHVRMAANCLVLVTCSLAVCANSQSFDSWQTANVPVNAVTPSNNKIPPALGWHEIPNTRLQSVCPQNNFGNAGYDFSDSCRNVIAAWSGGIADTKRNRLVIWGGGHTDYLGNELYALDLSSLQMQRLNDPTIPLARGCPEGLGEEAPNSRHTYGNLSYLPKSDEMLSVTGSLATCGGASVATWKLNLSTLRWIRLNPTGTAPFYGGGLAGTDYDPNTGNVYVSNESYGEFGYYNPGKNTYKLLSSGNITSTGMTAVIDPKRKLFFLIGGNPDNGGGVRAADISGRDKSYQPRRWEVTGCGPAPSASYPGAAYDPIQDRIVIWAGGDTIYLFDADRKSCESATYLHGPGEPQRNGTHGRFRYFSELGVFALVNDAKQNAFVLRLTMAGSARSAANFRAH
jgi:hypothetical protein